MCIGGVLYSAAQTAIAASEGAYLAAIAAGGLTVFFGAFVAAVACTLLVSSRGDAYWSDTGTTVRVNSSIAWCYGIALAGGVVGSACYLTVVSRGDAGLPFGSDGRGVVTTYLMIALLIISLIGLIAMLRTREPGHLRVGPNGVEHADVFRTRSVRWDEVVDITDKSDKQVRNPIVFVIEGAKPVVVGNADSFGSSGPALFWMTRHYWQHPEDRNQLVNGQALGRLREERFDAQ